MNADDMNADYPYQEVATGFWLTGAKSDAKHVAGLHPSVPNWRLLLFDFGVKCIEEAIKGYGGPEYMYGDTTEGMIAEVRTYLDSSIDADGEKPDEDE